MRNSIVGLVLACLVLAGLFALAKFDPPTNRIPDPAAAAAKIGSGFSGSQQVGPWALVCTPAPKSADGTPLKVTSATAFGRCRVTIIYHRKENPKQAVLLLTFRLLGPAQRLAVILVVPPVVKQGDILDLQAGARSLKMPISVCKDGQCIAVVALSPAGETELLQAPNGALIFPPDPSGKRGGVGVPFAGLRVAIGAMRRAES